MAQHEQDREDLLREATALTTRAELRVADFDEPVVIGFRTGGAASVFIGADPVYQFNAANELRRGFRDGRLIKAVDGTLYEMRRERAEGEVRLLRRPWPAEVAASYLKSCRDYLDCLLDSLNADKYSLIEQVPEQENVVEQIADWLETMPREIEIAKRPNVV